MRNASLPIIVEMGFGYVGRPMTAEFCMRSPVTACEKSAKQIAGHAEVSAHSVSHGSMDSQRPRSLYSRAADQGDIHYGSRLTALKCNAGVIAPNAY